MRHILPASIGLTVTLIAFHAAVADDILFESHIRPILKAQCWHCHGEEAEPEGGLDLRLARLITQGGESGAAVTPGQPDASLLYQRVIRGEMPPKDKKLSRSELDLIRRWIEQGARLAKPEPETIPPPGAITDEERSHWSFQPVRVPRTPTTKNPLAVRSPVDAFLLARLEERELAFSSEAPREVQIRRAALDLLGLPPTFDQVADFVADSEPDAWERVLDRMLASPRYGERWARHWLDVAGYADSEGYTERDTERKYAYKYRDYVIRALNADKPWKEMIVEQLAGDELLTPPYANLSPEQAEKLIATGFLRMGPDGTGDGGVDQPLARNDVVAETIKIASTSLLGLSVGCAQCHNHRYDPIAQTDYYRWRAIFEPALDVANWRAPSARLISLWTDSDRQRAGEVDAEVKQINANRTAGMDEIVQEIFEREVAKLPEDLREAARAARKTPEKERTPEQLKLIKEYPSLAVSPGSAYLYDQKRVDAHQKKFNDLLAAAQAKKPPEDFVHGLTEVPGKTPATHLFYRGDHRQPREAVEPNELAVLRSSGEATVPVDDSQLPTTGRRLAYAKHLTDGHHPLVGRVLVNRFWLHHFGRGIVATPADFGILGERPSHPELFDWLAARFTGSSEFGESVTPWSLKSLHRLLMTSSVYRQSSRRSDRLDQVDPENRLLGRMAVRRLEAEVIRDAILEVTRNAVHRPFGPPVTVSPDEVGMVTIGVDTRDSAGRPTGKSRAIGADEYRRSIFVQVRRTLPLSMLEAFDTPALAPNCEVRTASTVASQSLMLLNNDFVLDQSQAIAQRARQQAGDDLQAQVRLIWQAVLGTNPSAAQIEQARQFLNDQTQTYREQAEKAASEPVAPKAKDKDKDPPPDPSGAALANLAQALFSSNRFLYVE